MRVRPIVDLAAASSNGHMRVLVVDASRERRHRIVISLCELTNVVVVGAVGGVRSALYALAETTPDVMVMDSELDDRGPHLIAASQRCIRPPDVVVYGDAAAHDRCIDAGAEQFVPRTAGLAALQRAVGTAGRDRRRRAPATERFAQIGRMSAAASHDLRNYLGAAGLALSRLERVLDPVDRESLSTLRRALGAAERLTAAMLSYARGSVPDRGTVDLGMVVRNTLELFERTLPEGIHTEVAIVPVTSIRGVESELEQLVLNLMFNAVDAMPGGGQVMVTVREDAASVILEVRNTGIEGESRQPPLGLGIARDVAYRHDSKLRITTLPSGSQVSVELPIRRAV